MKFEGPKGFSEESAAYAALGFTIARISRFEHSFDEFIWQVAETYPKVCRDFSQRPPHTLSSKLDFLRHCLVRIPELRRVPFYDDGSISFTAIFLMAEEISSTRAFLAHGAIYASSSIEGKIRSYTLTKIKVRNKVPITENLQIGVRVLDEIGLNAKGLAQLFFTYTKILRDGFDVEKAEKEERVIRDNRKLLDSLGLLPEGMTVDGKEYTFSLPASLFSR